VETNDYIHVNIEGLAATKFNKILSGLQPLQVI